MNRPVKDTFERKTFTTSRLAEFATENELTKQIGHPASLMAARGGQGTGRQRARRRGAGRNRAGHHGQRSIPIRSSSPTMARAFPRRPSGSSPTSTPRPRQTPPMSRRPAASRATRCSRSCRWATSSTEGRLGRHRSQRPSASYRIHHRSRAPDAAWSRSGPSRRR